MDKDFGIRGREKEIRAIFKFVSNHVDASESGILYLTGPPGTGKTMSVNLVLDQFKNIASLSLNCFKAQSSKTVLGKFCDSLSIPVPSKSCDSLLISLLAKKLTGRTCKPFILILDEMDKLPRSSTTNFFHTILSWTKQSFSKLIIIGIANTVNLTARCQAFASFAGSDMGVVEKIIFKPYSSKDIQSILNWYLDNDENFGGTSVDQKVIEFISKKIAREKGDIRTAIDELRDTVYDAMAEKRRLDHPAPETYPTPPSTPPLTPRKDKTNLASAVSSARKRQRESHFFNEKAPPASEIVLICLLKLCSTAKDNSVDSKMFYGKARDILIRYGTNANQLDVKSVLEQLELQGTICFKKRPRMYSDKIVLRSSENEISRICHNKDTIADFISKFF